MAGKATRTPADDVGTVFARRLREARKARDWTQHQLSKALGDLGVQISQPTIAKMEKVEPRGRRPVRIEELVAIAACLDVSPMYLLLPWRLDAQVQLAPNLTVEVIEALRWGAGEGPLDRANERTYDFQAPQVRFVMWTPGNPAEAQHRGPWEGWQARQLAHEIERSDAEKGS